MFGVGAASGSGLMGRAVCGYAAGGVASWSANVRCLGRGVDGVLLLGVEEFVGVDG